MLKVSPFLWFDSEAEAAAEFYVSLFDNSRITSISRYPAGSPFPEGTAFGISFELDGLEVQSMNAGPGFPFTEAISFFVRAETQDEIDELWQKLTAAGGEESRCGWLKDRFGLSWQIVPPILGELLTDPDPARAGRVMQAMLGMAKIEIAVLLAAAELE